MLKMTKCLLWVLTLGACFHELHSAPFGPPYPITAAWFQDRFSKAEWNKTVTEFKTIGGDTVLLRAPAIRLRTEQELEQDPEFQVRHVFQKADRENFRMDCNLYLSQICALHSTPYKMSIVNVC